MKVGEIWIFKLSEELIRIDDIKFDNNISEQVGEEYFKGKEYRIYFHFIENEEDTPACRNMCRIAFLKYYKKSDL